MDAELDDELAFHLEMKTRDFASQGMPAREAEQAARRSLGNLTLSREEAREAWRFIWLADLVRDAQFGVRTLRAQPGFTVAATLALGLGIGLNGILFTVYNAMALTPWAIRDAKNTVQITSEDAPGKFRGFVLPEFTYLRERTKTLDALVANDNGSVRLRFEGQSWNAAAVSVSENFFDGIGTGFAAGRGFSRSAGDPLQLTPEIVLHHNTWVNRFGGAPDTVGKWLDVNGQPLQIVGIAAEGFAGPSPTAPHVWVTFAWRDKLNPGMNALQSTGTCCASVIGHMRPGVSRAEVQAEIQTLSAQFRNSIRQDPGHIYVSEPTLLAIPSRQQQMAKEVFMVIGLASLLILFLACANVANLQLARAQTRRREIAVRLSLGAARGRILRQLLAESLVLAGLAGLLTLAFVQLAPAIIVRWIIPSDQALAIRFDADWRVAAFLCGVSVLAALLFGLAPALSAIRDAVANGLREGGRTATGGRLRKAFLVAQVAICATLLGGTGLLVRALDKARQADPGFSFAAKLVATPNFGASELTDAQAQLAVSALSERIAQLPGVTDVAGTTMVPFGNTFSSTSLPVPGGGRSLISMYSAVSSNYLETLGTPMMGGRGFTRSDEGRNDVVIVNEALAAALFPGQDAIGKTIESSGAKQIIGMVRNSAVRELGGAPPLHFFVPSRGERRTRLLIRYTGPDAPLLSEIPKLARELDNRNIAGAAPFANNLDNARAGARIAASVAGALSLLALLLACVGIYGVAAYHVTQRTREIGVRMALGAHAGQIVRMVLAQNLTAVAIGGAVGLAGSFAFGSMLRSLLYGLSPLDPLAIVGASAVLAGAAVLAAWPNAKRAASIEPSAALRHD